MNGIEYKPGLLVENAANPGWGPGKIVHVGGSVVYVVFRDLPGPKAKKMSPGFLRVIPIQTDPILDNLPPLLQQGDEWVLPAERLTLNQAIEYFLNRFSGGFSDPEYIGDKYKGERQYKLLAHQRYATKLGSGQAQELLASGQIEELRRRALSVVSQVNLLSIFESAAFHDALSDAGTAEHFFQVLLRLLDAPKVTAEVFQPYADAVCDLPVEVGKSRVATWPVATILPYLAQPDRHMFLKPGVTQEAANRLGFDLHYEPRLNWKTYEALLRMGEVYMELLRPLGPRDSIDIQSFIYIACGGYESLLAKETGE